MTLHCRTSYRLTRCRLALNTFQLVRPPSLLGSAHPAVSTRKWGSSPQGQSKASESLNVHAKADPSEWRTLLSIGQYVWPRDNPQARQRVAIAGGLMIASKLLNIQVPLVLRSVVDSFSPVETSLSLAEGVVGVPFAAIFLYGAIRVGVSACSELRNVAFSSVSARANTAVSESVFAHMHNLSLQYHLSRKTGALSTSIERGKRGMQWILSIVVFNVVPTILEVALVSCLLGYTLGPQFAVVTAGTIGVYTVWTCAVASWRTEIRRAMNEADSAAGALAIDSLLNYETIKIFHAERAELGRYSKHLTEYEMLQRQTATSLAILNFGQQFVFATGMTAMLVLCAQGIVEGRMTVGDLVMANGYLLQLAMPLNWLGTMYSESRRSLVDFQGMISLLEEKSLQPLALPGATQLDSVRAALSVSFDKVSFRYPAASASEPPLLRDVSLHVPAGSTLGIVGQSGSGKSSLFRLLFRFYDPMDGCIKVNGRDIRSIELESLRQNIGMIPQDVVLFNSTLYDNVLFGRPDATRSEVEAAIQGAALHPLIAALPQGLDTLVGERGLKLSGGEKQRVAIARTLLKRPSVLLIDEGTSSLDSKTEADVLMQLKEVATTHTCTTIMIAHRLSTLQSADQICVLRDGVVSESGTHVELLQLHGEYADLWARQQEQEIR